MENKTTFDAEQNKITVDSPDKDALEWTEKVNFLEEVIEGLKKAISGLEFAASWARKATYQGMANQILSLKSTANTRMNDVLKEIDMLQGQGMQTRLI